MKDFFVFYVLWILGMVAGLTGLGIYYFKRRKRIKLKEAEEKRKGQVKTKLMQYHKIK